MGLRDGGNHHFVAVAGATLALHVGVGNWRVVSVGAESVAEV